MIDSTDARVRQLEAQRDIVLDRGKIDAIDAYNAVMVICDMFGVSPESTMERIADKFDATDMVLELNVPAQLIWNLLEISQSNPPRCIADLREVIDIEDKLDKLIDRDASDPEFR